MSIPKSKWQPVVEAALASRTADCGHSLSRKDNAIVWLRAEKVGAEYEVWSVCYDCKTDNDYMTYGGCHPYRDRREEI